MRQKHYGTLCISPLGLLFIFAGKYSSISLLNGMFDVILLFAIWVVLYCCSVIELDLTFEVRELELHFQSGPKHQQKREAPISICLSALLPMLMKTVLHVVELQDTMVGVSLNVLV